MVNMRAGYLKDMAYWHNELLNVRSCSHHCSGMVWHYLATAAAAAPRKTSHLQGSWAGSKYNNGPNLGRRNALGADFAVL